MEQSKKKAFDTLIKEVTQGSGIDPEEQDLSLAWRLFDAGAAWHKKHLQTALFDYVVTEKTEPTAPPPGETL